MKPRILLVGNFLSSRIGTRSVCEDLSMHLSGAGWSVIETSHRVWRIPRLLDMIFTILLRQREYKLAYVEVYSGLAFIWARFVVGLLNWIHKPVILALHGGGLVSFAEKHKERVVRLLKDAQIVVTPSQFLQSGLRHLHSDIHYLPNAIDISSYPFRVHAILAPRLIWLRAFHAIYNPQLAPRAIAELRALFPEITLTMVGPDKGDGVLRETQNLIEKLGLLRNIEIIPGVSKSQVPRILGQGEIFINTTNVDNTPVSVMEAMACGLCIVSTNVGGIPYLLKNEENALLVPPNDAQAMSTAIRRILDEPGLSERLSRNARSKAEEFDWSVVLPQWETLFQEVLARDSSQTLHSVQGFGSE